MIQVKKSRTDPNNKGQGSRETRTVTGKKPRTDPGKKTKTDQVVKTKTV